MGSDLAAAAKEKATHHHDPFTIAGGPRPCAWGLRPWDWPTAGRGVPAGQSPTKWDSGGVKTRIQCPCGETIVGKDEDELVELTNAHLKDQHDGRTYDRDMILMMAT